MIEIFRPAMKVSIQIALSMLGLIFSVLSFSLFGYARFNDMEFTSNFNNDQLFHNLRILLTETHETSRLHLQRSEESGEPTQMPTTINQTNSSSVEIGVKRNETSEQASSNGTTNSSGPDFRTNSGAAGINYRSERTLMAAAAASKRNSGADLSRVDRHQSAIQVIIMILNWFIAMFSAGIFYVHFRKKLEDLKSKKRVIIFLTVHALACAITFFVTINTVSDVNSVYLELESVVTPVDPLDGAILVASCYKSFYETYFNKVVRQKGWIQIRDSMHTCDAYAIKLLSAVSLAVAAIFYGFLAYAWSRTSSDSGNRRKRSSGRSDSLTRPSIYKGRQVGQFHITTLEAQGSSQTLRSVASKRKAQWSDNEYRYRDSQSSGYFR